MRGANGNRRKNAWGALKQEAAGPSGQKGPDPRNQIVIDSFIAQGGAEDIGVKVVKATLNVEK